MYQDAEQNGSTSGKSEPVSSWRFGKEVYRYASGVSVFREKLFQELGNAFRVMFKKARDRIRSKSVFHNGIMQYVPKDDLSRVVEVRSAKRLGRKFLFDLERAAIVGYVGSPSKYRRGAEYYVMYVVKIFVDSSKALLQLNGIHAGVSFFPPVIICTSIILHTIDGLSNVHHPICNGSL